MQTYLNKLLITILLLSGLALSAQDLTSYDDEISIVRDTLDMMTMGMDGTFDEVCKKCYDLARLRALEKKYGKVLIQGNATMIRNVQSGHEVETQQVFNMIAESLVNGEWLETTNQKYKLPDHKKNKGLFKKDRNQKYKFDYITCVVEGKARKLRRPKWDMDIKLYSCAGPVQDACNKTDFWEGESFYAKVTCPVDGYLTIFNHDSEVLQRLLPYRYMPEGMRRGVPMEAQVPYTFFSVADDTHGVLSDYVDPLSLLAYTERDINRLYFIYSPKRLIPPPLEDHGSGLPRELSVEKFYKWLAIQRAKNVDVAIFIKDYTITKRP